MRVCTSAQVAALLFVHVPEAEFADAGRIDQVAAARQMEQARRQNMPLGAGEKVSVPLVESAGLSANSAALDTLSTAMLVMLCPD